MRTWFAIPAAALLSAAAPASAAWHEARTKHFIVYADIPAEDLRKAAIRLEKFDKAVRLVRSMDDPEPRGDSERVTLYMLRDRDQLSWLAVGGPSPVAGIYFPRVSGAMSLVPKPGSVKDDGGLTGEAVFFHEYAHHLMYETMPYAIPTWLSEGFAEFFTSAKIEDDGEVRVGTPANHRYNGLRYASKPSIDLMFGDGSKKHAGDLFAGFYDWSWLYVHYLTFEPSRRGQIAKYVELIQREPDSMKAAEQAFGDLKKLDRETTRYYHKNKIDFLIINNPEIQNVSATVRKLRPGEDAIMWLRIQSDRGVKRRKAPSLANEMRSVAEKYPDDPFVWRSLAEAEFDARDYHAAVAAADRALTLDPRSSKSYVYRGLAQMKLAKGSKAADWPEIRSNFVKANRIDPSDGQALLQFYRSYLAAGEKPTPNAVDGLLYALELAPQDDDVRVVAIKQLLAEKRFDEAREELLPLSNYPHKSDARDRARAAMDFIVAKDGAGAIATLDARTEKELKKRSEEGEDDDDQAGEMRR